MKDNRVLRREFARCGAIAAMFPSIVNARPIVLPNEKEWLKPKGLRKGDTIAFVAPAGPADRAVVLSCKQQLEKSGFRVQCDERMLDRKKEYLAGHVSNNATLPHGATVELDANGGRVTLLEEPCIR